jgi:hypothetical protein
MDCSDSDGLLPAQIEIILTFFIGFYETGCYVESSSAIARRYLSSPTRFWFDVSTSIPLSYMDLYFAKVRRRRKALRSLLRWSGGARDVSRLGADTFCGRLTKGRMPFLQHGSSA